MRALPGPATADDVATVVDAAVDALERRLERDWHVAAGVLDWDCWETIEHIGESLFFYATQLVDARASIAGGYPYDYLEKRRVAPRGSCSSAPGPARSACFAPSTRAAAFSSRWCARRHRRCARTTCGVDPILRGSRR